jgi:hypothetical protein
MKNEKRKGLHIQLTDKTGEIVVLVVFGQDLFREFFRIINGKRSPVTTPSNKVFH